MRPIGFVICNFNSIFYTFGKIYPYYFRSGPAPTGDCELKIKDNDGGIFWQWMHLELKPQNKHFFDFYHYPEFPKYINKWTEDDWFQYHLKYGE